jgi:hypothetical protein
MTVRLDSAGVNYHPRSIREAPATAPIAKRVVLAVIDGLRPEAIYEFNLSNIKTIADLGASTLTGQSVSPTYATTCVASLMTGVSPSEHGMQTDRLSFPRHLGRVESLPRVISGDGFQTSAFMGEVPSTISGTAELIGRELGFQSFCGHWEYLFLGTTRGECSMKPSTP